MKVSVLLFFVALTIGNCYAQETGQALEIAKMQFRAKQVIPPAPEAAELGKYGNTPVSLFTGTPTISIPLFELKGNSLSLPVSLSYNASGFKPEDAAPWVGSGWSLNAGGVITRAALGNPDIETNYFGSATALNPPGSSSQIAYKNFIKNIQNGTIESQPDMYYYNFAGHSGKFMLRPDQTVFKKEKNLMIITPCITCSSSSFTVKDEQGITYVFSDVEMTRSIPSDDIGLPSYIIYNYPSAWYLTSMYNSNGDLIEFEYYTTSEQTLYQNMVDNKSVTYNWGTISASSCGYSGVDNSETSVSQPPTVGIKRKFLKKISLKKNNRLVASIELNSIAGGRQDSDFAEDRLLNQLNVYSNINSTGQLIKRYNFSYGYFSNGQNIKLLRLDTLREVGGDGVSSKPPYVFSYNNIVIPPRFTTALDHWGYYNEATGNSTLVPGIFVPFRSSGTITFPARNVGGNANREPTLAGSSGTMVNKIHYPTGGFTSFEYELNRATFNDGIIHSVGGIRIRQITDYTADNRPATQKTYSYLLDGGGTSGIGGIFPVYQVNSSYHHFATPYIGNACADALSNADYILNTISMSAHSVYGLGSFQGSIVGYSQVIESQTDINSFQPLGKTIFNYTTYFRSEDDDDLSNGDLVRQRVFNADGKLLEETANTYQYSSQGIVTGFKAKASDLQTNKTHWCKTADGAYVNYGNWENPPGSCLEGGDFPTSSYLLDYTITHQNKQLAQQVVTRYDQLSNQYITSTKTYTYANPLHNYPTLTKETSGNNQFVFTAVKYALDYNLPTVTTGIAAHIKDLVQQNMPGTAIEKLQYRQNADGSNTRYINGQITDYLLSNPAGIYFMESAQPTAAITGSSIDAAGNFIKDSRYRLAGTFNYDNNYNLAEQYKTGDAKKTYLWDYGFQYPVAEVTNAAQTQVAYTSFETDYKGYFNFAGAISADANAPTGKRCYTLTGNNITATTSATAIYILSYWSKNSTGGYTVSGGTSKTQGPVYNGWTYYEHTVTGVTTLTISGTGLIDEVRLYPKGALMTTMAYEPFVGAISQCDPASHITYYEYDALNRLVNTRDANRSIVKNFKYGYGTNNTVTNAVQTLFYNAATGKNFTKSNCKVGTPTVVTYRVPYGKYVSSQDQEAANAKAAAEIISNGQAYANTNGSCIFYSVQKSRRFFKNNCGPEDGTGNPYTYVVPAGSYTALTQTDADALAQTDLENNGQQAANSLGSCSCGAENQKMVGGSCEIGTRVNDASFQEGGVWKCSYHYQFSNATIKGPFYSSSSSPGACPLDAP